MNAARDLMIKCIRNEVHTALYTGLQQYRDPTITNEYDPIDNSHADARSLLLANKWYIAHESLYYAKQQNPGYQVTGGDVHCLSDIVDVIEALAYNTAHGGNNFIYEAGHRIVQYGTVTGDIDTMVDAYTKAKAMALDIMKNLAAGTVNTDNVKGESLFMRACQPDPVAVDHRRGPALSGNRGFPGDVLGFAPFQGDTFRIGMSLPIGSPKLGPVRQQAAGRENGSKQVQGSDSHDSPRLVAGLG